METTPLELINIITGQVASAEVQEFLINLKKDGEAAMFKNAKNILVESTNSQSFFKTQGTLKIKTFADMQKPISSDDKKKLICSSEVLFRRLLSVTSKREIGLREVLKYELASVPPALFNDDGSMRKTSKADLAAKIESFCPKIYSLSPENQAGNIAFVIDGMMLFQSVNESCFRTYDEFADYILKKKILSIFQCQNEEKENVNITIVFDQYREDSIKYAERQRCGMYENRNSASHVIQGSSEVPSYR